MNSAHTNTTGNWKCNWAQIMGVSQIKHRNNSGTVQNFKVDNIFVYTVLL